MKNGISILNALIISEISTQLSRPIFLVEAIETKKVHSIREAIEFDRATTIQLREQAKNWLDDYIGK